MKSPLSELLTAHPWLWRRWGVLALSLSLPTLGLIVLGSLWLWQHGLVWLWLIFILLISISLALGYRQLQQNAEYQPPWIAQPPPDYWLDREHQAYAAVEQLAQNFRQRDFDIADGRAWWQLTLEVMTAVAHRFHPDRPNSVLELRVPDLLKVIELLARDLRQLTNDYVFFSHQLTVNDLRRGKQLVDQGQFLFNLYRYGRFIINPAGSLAAEAQGLLLRQSTDAGVKELKAWLLDAAVKKVGFYAVELYSGRLPLDDGETSIAITNHSHRDLATAQAADVRTEPLRLLVAGAVGVGKSTLINHLFGEPLVPTGIAAMTTAITPYPFSRDGAEVALLFDSPGYGGNQHLVTELIALAPTLDGIILVIAAHRADRDADRQLVAALQALQPPPLLLVALTHVDRLKPMREWQPPYNVQTPDSPKAHSIRNAMDHLATALDLPVDQIVPVCLAPETPDDVTTSLLPSLYARFDQGRRRRLLRCLDAKRRQQQWSHLWTQAHNTGRFLLKQGADWFNKPPAPPVS